MHLFSRPWLRCSHNKLEKGETKNEIVWYFCASERKAADRPVLWRRRTKKHVFVLWRKRTKLYDCPVLDCPVLWRWRTKADTDFRVRTKKKTDCPVLWRWRKKADTDCPVLWRW